jgi:hypothetical protein
MTTIFMGIQEMKKTFRRQAPDLSPLLYHLFSVSSSSLL